jgi:hypothetical protein
MSKVQFRVSREKARIYGHFYSYGSGDRRRLVRDFMAERDLGENRTGRFACRADLEDSAQDLEEAKWPTDREGRVTRETDLDSKLLKRLSLLPPLPGSENALACGRLHERGEGNRVWSIVDAYERLLDRKDPKDACGVRLHASSQDWSQSE